jgi:hypothetical protein
MPEQRQDKRPHLVLKNTSKAQLFKAPSARGRDSPQAPHLDRAQHGASLKAQLQALKSLAKQAAEAQKEQGLESGFGLQIEFIGMPDIALAFESLGNERARDPKKMIELLSIRTEANTTYANVFIPDGKLAHFEKYIADYLAERKKANGDWQDHHTLLNTISSIRSAELRALWTDDPELLVGGLATSARGS